MKTLILIVIALFLGACNKSSDSSLLPLAKNCDSLNALYSGYTKEQLLVEAAEYNNAAIALADSEYYVNLYTDKSADLIAASECK